MWASSPASQDVSLIRGVQTKHNQIENCCSGRYLQLTSTLAGKKKRKTKATSADKQNSSQAEQSFENPQVPLYSSTRLMGEVYRFLFVRVLQLIQRIHQKYLRISKLNSLCKALG